MTSVNRVPRADSDTLGDGESLPLDARQRVLTEHINAIAGHQMDPVGAYRAEGAQAGRWGGGILGGAAGTAIGAVVGGGKGALLGAALGAPSGALLGHMAGRAGGETAFNDDRAYLDIMQRARDNDLQQQTLLSQFARDFRARQEQEAHARAMEVARTPRSNVNWNYNEGPGDKYASAHYGAGVDEAFDQLGMDKEAFLSALRAGFTAAKPLLQTGARAATSMARQGHGIGAAANAVKNTGMAAGRTFGNAFAQAAPGTTKALQTTGKVLGHPATQTALLAAPMVMG